MDPAHPLVELLTRSREVESAVHLRLDNLPPPSHVALIAETLRADPAVAASLAEAIGPNASGNPYETVEVLNALRRDGLLTATPSGWRWDAAAVRDHLGHTEIAALTAARVEALPRASADLLAAMACLGGRAELRAIHTATGEPAAAVERLLAPALDDGLLIAEPGLNAAVRFRHDRIRETILDRLGERHRRGLQLAMARRLAAVPEFVAVAAEQYLPVVDALDDPDERRRVARLLQRAADQGAMIGDNRLVNALLLGGAAADRPGGDGRADRSAHCPPRRVVRPGAPRRGRRRLPRDRGPGGDSVTARRRDGGTGARPHPPQPHPRSPRAGLGGAGRARHRGRRSTGSPPTSTTSSLTCTGGSMRAMIPSDRRSPSRRWWPRRV